MTRATPQPGALNARPRRLLAGRGVRRRAGPGINGLLVNGHAGKNSVLSLAENRRVVELARKHALKDCLIVSGVNHESSLETAREAAALHQAVADGLLVFPLNSWGRAPRMRSCILCAALQPGDAPDDWRVPGWSRSIAMGGRVTVRLKA
jgi:hypothetical protein